MKNLKKVLFGCGLTMAMFTACNSGVQPQLTVSGLDPAKFDTLINEKPVKLYTQKSIPVFQAYAISKLCPYP